MKIMLDECVTLRASRLLIEALKLHKPPIEAAFLEDYLSYKGSLDIEWAGRLESEGGWCVVTCDNGKARGGKAKLKGPPLHLILPAKRITGFFLAGKISAFSGFEKARSVLYTLPEIIRREASSEPGSRFKIIAQADGYIVKEWPLTGSLPVIL